MWYGSAISKSNSDDQGGSGGDLYAKPGGTRESRLMRKIARHRFDVLAQTAEHVDGVKESLDYLRGVVRLHGKAVEDILSSDGKIDIEKVKEILPGREARLAAEALLRHQRMVAKFEDLPEPPAAPDGEKPELHIHLHGDAKAEVIDQAAQAMIEARGGVVVVEAEAVEPEDHQP